MKPLNGVEAYDLDNQRFAGPSIDRRHGQQQEGGVMDDSPLELAGWAAAWRCPHCHGRLTENDLHPDTNVARCIQCHAMVQLPRQKNKSRSSADALTFVFVLGAIVAAFITPAGCAVCVVGLAACAILRQLYRIADRLDAIQQSLDRPNRAKG